MYHLRVFEYQHKYLASRHSAYDAQLESTDEFSKPNNKYSKSKQNGPHLEYPPIVDVRVRLETMKIFTRSEYFPGTDADVQFDVTATKLSMEQLTNKAANKSYRELNEPFTQLKLYTEAQLCSSENSATWITVNTRSVTTTERAPILYPRLRRNLHQPNPRLRRNVHQSRSETTAERAPILTQD